ncbi:hypothetical protein NCS52_00325000 [Fusarium sp. LHS14.1]|nr:hypothetical protein NCS52_00325000 [Fusarium sp. LHS14.1]
MGEKVSEKKKAGIGMNDGEEQSPSAFRAYLRVFTYGDKWLYTLEFIAVIAAIAAGVALAMVNVVLGNFVTLLSEPLTSESARADFMSRVRTSALRFVYIGIARFVGTYIYSSLFTYVAHRFTRNIRWRYLHSAFSQEIAFFDQGSSGSISMQTTSSGKLIQSGTAEKLGMFVQAISAFVAAFVMAFITQWKLTLITSCIVPVVILICGVVSWIDVLVETGILKVYGMAGGYAESTLGGVRAVQAFGLRRRLVAKYKEYLEDAYNRGMKKNVLYGFAFGGEYSVLYCGMGLSFWQGVRMLSKGEIADIGTVFTVVFSVIVAAQTITSIVPHLLVFNRAASAAVEMFSLIDRESSINPFDESGERPDEVQGNIEIQGIHFSYPSRPDVTVLDNFTLTVPKGKVTALVGPSGSGKSTIIGLLERWYNPSQGMITLDGRDIKALNLRWLRTNVRLVQQEPVLFNGSVYDNIVTGLIGTVWEDVSIDEKKRRVEDAAKLAFAHDFVTELAQGYDTSIGQRGGLLSGGQKQRIAIARSIISDPKILLLDEATSALDPQAEHIVQQALDNASKNRTTITIAHKLATIRGADNIVVMSHGRISEQGTHEQLSTGGGLYEKLVRAQDLAPSSDTESATAKDDDMSDTEDVIPVSLTKTPTREATALQALRHREDFDHYKPLGLIRSVVKLISMTPELAVWYFVALLTCTAGAAIFPGQAILLAKILDASTSSNMVSRGNFFALMFFIMGLGSFVAYFIMGWGTNIIAQTLSRKARLELFDQVLKQDLRFFDRPENAVGALISRLDSYPQAILELMGINVGLVVLAGINVLISSVLALAVSWRVAVVGVFVALPPMLLAGFARVRLEAKVDAGMSKRYATSSAVASETVMAIRTVSSLAIERSVLASYAHELDTAISTSVPGLFHMMIWFALTQSIEFFMLGLGFWWGSKLISEGKVTFYQFIASFMAVYFCGQGAGQMFVYSSSFSKAVQAANYYFWMLDLEPEITESDDNRDVGPAKGCTSLQFEKVKFSYPLAPNIKVLKGVSLDIRPGEFVAFVGASGCGKSTMISLLERFYDPTSGRIVVDQAEALSSLNPRLYRQHVALVQQEPTLFPGSIRDNISHGKDDDSQVSEAEMEEACRAANAWEFVMSLPEGLNTPCGEGGSQLSGGQRQRVAIARALVRKPKVILLDEATSALDTESERVVQKALMEAAAGDRITVAVAHRLSTIRGADRIFVFYGGDVVEAGTHEELIGRGRMYAKMCEAQNLGV